MERSHLIATVFVLALALGAGAWYARGAPEPPPPTVVSSGPDDTALTVHVSGAVLVPGMIEVPSGSRVADAVAAAGGALPDADLTMLNLAAPVGDGQHLVVPVAGAGNGAAGSSADDRVRINTAGVADLERLPGVGPVLAERIVRHREAYGPFGAVEDLLDVPGIGEAKLAALRESVRLP